MSYYERYIKQTRRFQAAGIVMIGLAILINELTGRTFAPPVWILAGAGLIPLVIGGSGSTSHGIVKTFAVLLENDPTTVNAKEFLTALNNVGRVSLVKRSRQMVESAVRAYEKSPEADADLVKELREATEKCIRKRAF